MTSKTRILKPAAFAYLIAAFLFLVYTGPTYAQEVHIDSLLRAIIETEDESIAYVPDYIKIPYPMGDVPPNIGVCTDVIIRVYRKVGIDLQKEVHEDISANFNIYPSGRIWGLKGPDKNIDHRRVPNLMTFFSRHGKVLGITNNRGDYKPGHIVCWKLSNGLPHIGIVSGKSVSAADSGKGYYVLHNIGGGQVLENCLFSYEITGHYEFMGKNKN